VSGRGDVAGVVASGLARTLPDRLTIWPVEEDRFGIDVRWRVEAR
jgi:hypothetical protein